MGLFGSIVSGISSAVSSVCRCVSSVCSGIAGVLGGSSLGKAVSSFVSKIGVALPGLNIVSTIITVANIVSGIAEVLAIKEQDKDAPDELALKAEKCDEKPEDFASTEAYIKHLHENVKLSKEETRERFDNMSREERTAYRAVGTYLYAKACSERLGFDKEGLRNPELKGITSDILADLSKLQHSISPSEFVMYSKYLMSNGLGMKDFSAYLHNRSTDLSTDEKVQSALTDAIKEMNPGIAQGEINQKLYAMNIEE